MADIFRIRKQKTRTQPELSYDYELYGDKCQNGDNSEVDIFVGIKDTARTNMETNPE